MILYILCVIVWKIHYQLINKHTKLLKTLPGFLCVWVWGLGIKLIRLHTADDKPHSLLAKPCGEMCTMCTNILFKSAQLSHCLCVCMCRNSTR